MELHRFQAEALEILKNPTHLLCLAPTGSGKSLIYERIAAESGRRTLLITPLVALARQQAERLSALRIRVAQGQHPGAKTGVWILSPESLLSPSTLSRLKSWRPDFLVVDECHCLYDWGAHFRKAFLEVPGLIRQLGIGRSLWLTATLPKDARIELDRLIGEPLHFLGKFALPSNLRLSTPRVPWIRRAQALLERISAEREPGIVFVTTREATHRVSRLLSAFGRRAISYHAGMSQEERRLIETDLRKASDAVLVATSAFGMGMDYAHLRWCVLWQPPSSLLSLAQAVGRIGRKRELEARACVFWDDEDFRALQWMTQGVKRRVEALGEVRSYLMTNGCRTLALEQLLNGESAPHPIGFCGHCEFCYAPQAA